MSKNDSVYKITSLDDNILMDNATFTDDLYRHFYFTLGRDKVNDSHLYLYNALAITIRDRLVAQWRDTRSKRIEERSVAYLSLEFLMGRTLNNAVLNLDLDETVRESLKGIVVILKMLKQQNTMLD